MNTAHRLSINQQIALEAIAVGRLYSISRRYRQINTIHALIARGLVEFIDVNLGNGEIGGKYAITEAGRQVHVSIVRETQAALDAVPTTTRADDNAAYRRDMINAGRGHLLR